MRKFYILFILSLSMFASEIEVTADKFSANEKELNGIFKGNVKIKKQHDELNADLVKIFFNKSKKPIKYEATGNANFKLNINKKTYFGKGKLLVYEPINKRYSIIGDAFLREIETDKKIYGEKIIVNQSQGTYEVDGKSSEPVKFIFKIDEQNVKNY